MDTKLSKALDFSQYMTTLNNQKRLLWEKYQESLIYYYNGGKFTITSELIAYCHSAILDNVVLIDNRERLNFLEQHIPGSINIPYRTLATDGKILRTKESMKNLLKNRGIPEDAEIITYCGSVGTLSGLAYYALKSIGVPNVKLYVNSFKEWKKLEKPIGKQENAAYWDLSAE